MDKRNVEGERMIRFTYACQIVVQAKDKEEAKRFIEKRLQNLLRHPDGLNIKDILEVE